MDLWYWLAAGEMVPRGDPSAELLREAERLDTRLTGEEGVDWSSRALESRPRASGQRRRIVTPPGHEQTPAA